MIRCIKNYHFYRLHGENQEILQVLNIEWSSPKDVDLWQILPLEEMGVYHKRDKQYIFSHECSSFRANTIHTYFFQLHIIVFF